MGPAVTTVPVLKTEPKEYEVPKEAYEPKKN